MSTWRPLLDGDLRSRALDVVDAIARDLADPPPASDRDDVPPLQRAIDETCLARGRAGLALFFAFKAIHDDDPDARRHAIDFLDEAFDNVARIHLSSSLFMGFPGVAWAAELLEGELLRSGNDPNEDVDDALLRMIDAASSHVEYDLISGLTGIGFYCVERFTHPAAAKCLELIVDRLEDSAETTSEGLTWFTPPEMMPPTTKEEFVRGFYNLGMAHGITGVIGLLARIYEAGVATRRVRPLLAGAVDWLIAQKIDGEERSVFPAVVVAGKPKEPSRTAWCYGDPGVAVALNLAAHAVGDRAWSNEALGVSLEVARRPAELCGVNDAGLCHGATGLAHILNRLAVATGDVELEHAARAWFARALEMRTPGEGIGGYRSWRSGRDVSAGWIDHPGLLAGAAGIGLALMAATGSVEPSWDRCLLLSSADRDGEP